MRTHSRIPTTTPTRVLAALAVSIVGLISIGSPTLAQPADDDVLTAVPPTPAQQPDDDQLTIVAPLDLVLEGQCEPESGFNYETVNVPPNMESWTQSIEWRPEGSAEVNQSAGGSGFVPTPAGDFEARATLTSPRAIAAVAKETSEWKPVTVPHCWDDRRTRLTLEAKPVCSPTPGVNYLFTFDNQPPGHFDYHLAWEELPVPGAFGTADGQSGFIPTGEGDFELQGHAQHEDLGFAPIDAPPVTVTVDCDEPDDDDTPRRGTPRYTG